MATEDAKSREWFDAELERMIVWFRKEANKHKQMHRRLRYLVFTLMALSTILASVALWCPDYYGINVAIVGTTALAGLATSVEGLRKPAELWHTERRTEYALLDIKRELEFYSLSNNKRPDLEDCFRRMQGIISAAGETWSQNIKLTPQTMPPVGNT